MNITLGFLLGELLLVSLGILVFIGFSGRRRSRLVEAELSALSERIGQIVPLRQIRLEVRLQESFGLPEDQAERLSADLIRSERKLFRIFTELLLGGDVRKLGVFDQTVYALVDQYWDLIGLGNFAGNPGSGTTGKFGRAHDSNDIFSVELPGEALDDRTGFGADQNPEAANADFARGLDASDRSNSDPEPSWDDAFAEMRERQECLDCEHDATKDGPGP